MRLFSSEASGRLIETRAVEKANKGITCLKALDAGNDVVCTAGRDGVVVVWDMRTGGRVSNVSVGEFFSLLVLLLHRVLGKGNG